MAPLFPISRHPKRIGILTGGGDCPGLNAVIRAVVKSATQKKIQVLGFKDGFLGLVQNSTCPLPLESVSNILTLGGTILGASNKDDPFHMLEKNASGKIQSHDRSPQVLKNLKNHAIEVLVVLGGDGTMTIANHLHQKGVPIIGIPKTIDNDLVGTDLTFGHDTAVQVAAEAIDRLHTTADSHHRIMVIEIMGRYAGWLALRSGLASGGDAILIPEFPYRESKVSQMIQSRYQQGRKSSLVVVAEGAYPQHGKHVIDHLNPLSPEKIRLGGIGRLLAKRLESQTGIEARAVVLGHVVRGGTPTPQDRILATLFGVQAVELISQRQFGVMVTWKNGMLGTIPLSKVGGQTRLVPKTHALIRCVRRLGVSLGV
jgi:6-phosphofructokinase 1